MKYFLIITLVLISLCSCQTVAGNVATNIAIQNLIRPVAEQVVEGGKYAFNAASEAWQKWTSPDDPSNEESLIKR